MGEPSAVPTVADLLTDPAKGLDVPPGDAAAMLLALAPVVKALELAAGRAPAPERNGNGVGGRDLTEGEAAKLIGKSPRWVRDNWRTEGMPGRKRGRTTMFPELELVRWQKRP